MTNQKAINELQYVIDLIKQDGKDWLDERDIPILEAVISVLQAQEETVSRKVYEQMRWERNIAVMQLKDLEYGLREKIRMDGDTISRQTAIDALDEIESEVADGYGYQYEKWRKYFCELPSVQPERKKGKWIVYYECPKCGEITKNFTEYCPFCNADMRGERDG